MRTDAAPEQSRALAGRAQAHVDSCERG